MVFREVCPGDFSKVGLAEPPILAVRVDIEGRVWDVVCGTEFGPLAGGSQGR